MTQRTFAERMAWTQGTQGKNAGGNPGGGWVLAGDLLPCVGCAACLQNQSQGVWSLELEKFHDSLQVSTVSPTPTSSESLGQGQDGADSVFRLVKGGAQSGLPPRGWVWAALDCPRCGGSGGGRRGVGGPHLSWAAKL